MSDDKILNKVRALLAKAESTTHPEEAESYTAKAQELMSRYAIEESMLANAKHRNLTVTSITIHVAAPYTKAKAILLSEVAKANDCKVIGIGGIGGFERTTIFGVSDDIDATEAIWTSLLMQQAQALLQAEPVWRAANQDRGLWRRESAQSFRQSFMVGYANRIGERLRETKAATVAEYERETGTSTALVLRDKGKLVADAAREAFPDLRTRRTSVSGSGYYGGKAAANNANIGQRGLGQRKAVGS